MIADYSEDSVVWASTSLQKSPQVFKQSETSNQLKTKWLALFDKVGHLYATEYFGSGVLGSVFLGTPEERQGTRDIV